MKKLKTLSPWIMVGLDLEMIKLNLEKLENYYQNAPRFRGMYFVAMKRMHCKRLRENGLTLYAIARILNCNHATVLHHIRSPDLYDTSIENLVRENWAEWISKKAYPYKLSVDEKNNAVIILK
jgi:hypothetical protein